MLFSPIEMMSKVRKHSVDILRDCSTFYDQFLELFQRYSEIPIENIPAEYLYRKATASQ